MDLESAAWLVVQSADPRVVWKAEGLEVLWVKM